jgi:hypothetical protein
MTKKKPSKSSVQHELYTNLNSLPQSILIISKDNMDKLRKEAREALIQTPGKVPTGFLPGAMAASKCDLGQLWEDISSHDHSTHLNVSCFKISIDIF